MSAALLLALLVAASPEGAPEAEAKPAPVPGVVEVTDSEGNIVTRKRSSQASFSGRATIHSSLPQPIDALLFELELDEGNGNGPRYPIAVWDGVAPSRPIEVSVRHELDHSGYQSFDLELVGYRVPQLSAQSARALLASKKIADLQAAALSLGVLGDATSSLDAWLPERRDALRAVLRERLAAPQGETPRELLSLLVAIRAAGVLGGAEEAAALAKLATEHPVANPDHEAVLTVIGKVTRLDEVAAASIIDSIILALHWLPAAQVEPALLAQAQTEGFAGGATVALVALFPAHAAKVREAVAEGCARPRSGCIEGVPLLLAGRVDPLAPFEEAMDLVPDEVGAFEEPRFLLATLGNLRRAEAVATEDQRRDLFPRYTSLAGELARADGLEHLAPLFVSGAARLANDPVRADSLVASLQSVIDLARPGTAALAIAAARAAVPQDPPAPAATAYASLAKDWSRGRASLVALARALDPANPKLAELERSERQLRIFGMIWLGLLALLALGIPALLIWTGPSAYKEGHCAKCQRGAKLNDVTFRQNIGMLLAHRYSSEGGYLCKRCIHGAFWKAQLVNATVGWWGMKSLVIAPYAWSMNWFNYLRSVRLPSGDLALAEPLVALPVPDGAPSQHEEDLRAAGRGS